MPSDSGIFITVYQNLSVFSRVLLFCFVFGYFTRLLRTSLNSVRIVKPRDLDITNFSFDDCFYLTAVSTYH